MEPWYLKNLVCPRDRLELQLFDRALECPASHRYPVVNEVPVMLREDVKQTMDIVDASLRTAKNHDEADERLSDLYLDSLSISDEEKRGVIKLAAEKDRKVDPVVAFIIGATNGNMYKHLIGRLDSYPIPHLRLPTGNGETFLDLGCNWGRWSIAAARKGYQVVGIDPSLGAIMAAKRVSDSLGLSIKYLVADARYLPFRSNAFHNIFSYSVLQHLAKEDVELVLSDVGRVLVDGGTCLIQMPTTLGLRCLYHQVRRGFKRVDGFEVRYWSLPSLRRIFTKSVGTTEISVDCYFGIGLQGSDSGFMPPNLRVLISSSELLRRFSRFAPFMKYLADSVYVKAVKA